MGLFSVGSSSSSSVRSQAPSDSVSKKHNEQSPRQAETRSAIEKLVESHRDNRFESTPASNPALPRLNVPAPAAAPGTVAARSTEAASGTRSVMAASSTGNGAVQFEQPIPVDASWKNTSVGAAISGTPPKLDLNRVTATQVQGLSESQQRDFFGMLNRSGGHAIVAFPGQSPEGIQRTTNLAGALSVKIWNESKSPALLESMLRTNPSALSFDGHMGGVYSERTVNGVKDLMARGGLTGTETDNLLRMVQGHLRWDGGGSDAKIRGTLDAVVDTLTRDGLTLAEGQKLAGVYQQFPQTATASRVGSMLAGFHKTGQGLDTDETALVGDVVQSLLKNTVGDDVGSQKSKDTVASLLKAITVPGTSPHLTQDMVNNPRFMGAAMGSFLGGLVGYADAIDASSTQRQNLYSDLAAGALTVVTALPKLNPAAAVALSVLSPFTSRIIEDQASSGSNKMAYALTAKAREGIQNNTQWTPDQRTAALEWLETAMNSTGYPS
jgi:hypothetical protein